MRFCSSKMIFYRNRQSVPLETPQKSLLNNFFLHDELKSKKTITERFFNSPLEVLFITVTWRSYFRTLQWYFCNSWYVTGVGKSERCLYYLFGGIIFHNHSEGFFMSLIGYTIINTIGHANGQTGKQQACTTWWRTA